VTTVLLDTHTLVWLDLDDPLLSQTAKAVIQSAADIVIASVSWYELAWLVQNRRIEVSQPLVSWLDELSHQVRTAHLTPAIAATAVNLPATFPSDPTDRVIYATAIENGWRLVTRDEALRRYDQAGQVTVW
jgi:PIN domain nuclease of toxin-antitoxin system